VEDRDYHEIKERVAERLLRIPGVHMIAVGAKQVDGERTGDAAITLFVERKRPLSEIPSEERIPEEIEGVKTDVIEMPPPTIGQTGPGQLFGANRDDGNEYRPVRGGSQIARANGNSIGTLGCLCTVSGDPNTVIALTNHHVIYENCSDSPNHEEVGQPKGSTSSSACCSDIIGTVLDAQCDQEVDITLVKLNGGAEWLAEVQEVGRITARHDITATEVNPLATPPITYPVKKRGRRTRLTGGVVTHTGAIGQVLKADGTVHRSYNNVMIIDPNPDPASPGTPTDFHLPGDSGSALLNEFDMVVGITFGQVAATATTKGVGLAFPIKALIDKFAEGVPVGRRIELAVATADRAGDVHTVPTAMVADGQPALPPITPGQAERLEEEIRTTRRGARYSDLARRHREEVGALIHSNRRVTVAWHRSGAAEVMQWLVRAFSTPGLRVPAEIQGRPVRACLEDLAAVVTRHGSAALGADIRSVLPTLPDVSGLTDREIVERLKGAEPAMTPGSA
jgi:hypothetical protein